MTAIERSSGRWRFGSSLGNAKRSLPCQDIVVPIEVHRLHTSWRRLYRVWWAGHYVLGLLGAVAGVLVASKEIQNWEWLTGLVIAITTTLVTFLGPLRRAQAYYRAFHLLDQGCLERRIGHITDSQLCAVVADAREIVLDRVGLYQPSTIEDDPRFSEDPRRRPAARRTAPPDPSPHDAAPAADVQPSQPHEVSPPEQSHSP